MAHSSQLTQLYSIAPKGISLGLTRMKAALKRLGNPEEGMCAIQIAGTNGKGSVSTILEQTIRTTGVKTGLFTSPHLHRFTERIRINGKEISFSNLERQLAKVLELTNELQPIPLTFFEVATLTALLIFKEEKTDVVVLEVGLGGRLDATSAVTPIMGVITSIGMDHMDYLGNTIDAIAREKAGIAKAGIPILCGHLCDEAKHAIEDVASGIGAPVLHLNNLLPKSDLQKLDSFFRPSHQHHNVSLALEAFSFFRRSRGLANGKKQFLAALQTFGINGRLEWIKKNNSFLLDGAHNLEAITKLVETLHLQNVPVSKIVFGALQGKPIDPMLRALLSVSKNIVLVPAPIERSMDAEKIAKEWNLQATSIDAALNEPTREGGVTLITGSFFVVGEARRQLLDEPAQPAIGL